MWHGEIFPICGALHNVRDQTFHSAANFMGTCWCTQFCFRIFEISCSELYCIFAQDLLGLHVRPRPGLKLYWTPDQSQLGCEPSNLLCFPTPKAPAAMRMRQLYFMIKSQLKVKPKSNQIILNVDECLLMVRYQIRGLWLHKQLGG